MLRNVSFEAAEATDRVYLLRDFASEAEASADKELSESSESCEFTVDSLSEPPTCHCRPLTRYAALLLMAFELRDRD